MFFRIASFLLVGVLSCTSSRAAIFERDWLVPGDGLITFDNVNQREWLDLSETILDQYPGNSLEEIFQNVVAETESGGMFEGFFVATSSDAEALALSAGIDINTESYSTNSIPTKKIINSLGVTLSQTTNKFLSAGLVDEVLSDGNGVPIFTVANFAIFDADNGGPKSRASFSLGPGADAAGFGETGVMLYRNVPEPSALLLVYSAVGAVLGLRRR